MPPSNNPTSETIIPHDRLSHLILEPDMLVTRPFVSIISAIATLRYYHLLSLSIERLARHHPKTTDNFQHPTRNQNISIQDPVHHSIILAKGTHFHSHRRSPSPPIPTSSNIYVDSPSIVEVIPLKTEPHARSPFNNNLMGIDEEIGVEKRHHHCI
jgi:hypothetical protein